VGRPWGRARPGAAGARGAALGGGVVASARWRRRLAGLAPAERAGAAPGAGIYAPEWTERVYAGLVARAEPIVASRRVAGLDASVASRAARRRARQAAGRPRAAPAVAGPARPPPLLESRAGERLASRAAVGADASDAGPELLEASLAGFEPVLAEEGIVAEAVDTGDPRWPEDLARRAAAWR